MKKIISISVFLIAFVSSIQAQKTFATVELSRKSVYPGEPFQLKVTTYTSTFYLSPISFADFRVPNAFTVNFSRTLSGVNRIDGQQYATLQFFMQVYPLESGFLEIPSMELSFQSPPDGDYKGKDQLVITEAKNITIRPIPENTAVNPWFVASRVTLLDKWDKNKTIFKVGDVLERTIVVKAFGTLPFFIPELDFKSQEGLEIYPKTAVLEDKRNDEQAIGWKTQRVLYLLTKEGEVSISAMEVEWFNPLTNKPAVSKLQTKTIQVKSNNNMGMLESIKDSLDVSTNGLDGAKMTETKDYRKMGLLAVISLFLVFFIWKMSKYLQRFLEYRKQQEINYRKSSVYHYKQIFKKLSSPEDTINAINLWWDLARNTNNPTSVSEALKEKKEYAIWLKMQELNQNPDKQEVKKVVESLLKSVNKTEQFNNEFSINP